MDHDVRDRQDVPIWNAIDAKNFKQALKLVDKRLARKRTEYLEALKIYIRTLLSSNPSERSSLLLSLEELVGKKGASDDLDAIELYGSALDEVLPSRQSWARIIGELRWQHVKAAPRNEESSLKCFQACLGRDDLDHARQIANILEKNFPQNHGYIFWNITMMFMYSISPTCPDQQKKIWGGLAYGQIGKLAAATKQAIDAKNLPARAIQTPQELLLLHKITETYGKPEQRLAYLDDPHLGPESAVAKGEWQLWRIKLKLMEDTQQWDKVFEITSSLLKRARTKDESGIIPESQLSDWIVWDAFISSVIHLSGQEYVNKLQAEVEVHLDPATGISKSWRRNASLAWIKMQLEFPESSFIPQSLAEEHTKVTAILTYLKQYGHTSTAYNDICLVVKRLEPDERCQVLMALEKSILFKDSEKSKDGPFTADLSTVPDIISAVNNLKLRYFISCSLSENDRRQSLLSGNQVVQPSFRCVTCKKPCGLYCEACLRILAQRCIHSYKTAMDDDGKITQTLLPTDRHPADDLCILSAMCLIKLSKLDSKPSSDVISRYSNSLLFQATALLEYAWSHSKSNFQISLMLVRLYSYLGCGSLAKRAYQRLAVKQVQIDTLSYTLFDRISTLHPHSFSNLPEGYSEYPSPLTQLVKHKKFYQGVRDQVNKNVWLSFKHGSYNAIFQIMEVSDILSHSMSNAMTVVEDRKMSRLVEQHEPKNDLPGDGYITSSMQDILNSSLIDTNDYASYPNFESREGQTFEELTRSFPPPSNYRYLTNIFAEKLSLTLHSQDITGEKATHLQWLKQYITLQKPSESAKTASKELTIYEELTNTIYYSMALVTLELYDGGASGQADSKSKLEPIIKTLVENFEAFSTLIQGIQDLVPAFSSTLHALYTAHEVGMMAAKFVSSKEVGEVAKAAQLLQQSVANKVTIIKKGLDEGGFIDRVLESALPFDQENEDFGVVDALRSLVDENFLEEWAGEVVESWRDSAVGFTYFKVPK